MNPISAAASLLGDVQTKVAEVAYSLLKETTNPDTVRDTGKTALALGSEEGFGKAIEYLVDKGASVDLRSEHGRRVLLLVTERGWYKAGDGIVERARLVAEQEALEVVRDRIFLLIAAYEDDIDASTQLLDKTSRLQVRSEDKDIGAAGLFLAVENDSIRMVKTLLKFGIDINSKDDSGQAALHRATRRKNKDMVRLLLSGGADVECKDDDNHTAWSGHLRSKDTDVLRILLDAGADPNTSGQQGVSELYTAAKNGETEIVAYMLESGTNPSIRTQYGWAPLHWAASYGHLDCVRLLLDRGADVNAVSDQQVTPLDLATQANQEAILELLHKFGAKRYRDMEADSYSNTDDRGKDGGHRPAAPKFLKLASERAKLHLCYDKPLTRTLVEPKAIGRFVYPSGTIGATDNIYEVSQFLETLSDALSIRRSDTRVEMWHYANPETLFDSNDMLYEIVRVNANDQEFELQGRHQNPFPGKMTMRKDPNGGWEIRHESENDKKPYLLRMTPEWSKNKEEDSRWLTEGNVLQARSGWDDATPWITIELGVEKQLQDLIVTCWIVKLWSETALMQRQD